MTLVPVTPPAVFPPALPADAPLAAAALAYATAGIPVFPLSPGEKIPCVAHGFHAATTRPATIRQWWREWPQANIGVPTGEPSRLVVLDIDPRHGGDGSLRHLQRVLDHHAADCAHAPIYLLDTCQAYSGGGGLHLFFGWLPSSHLRTTTRLAGEEGLDLRGTGGYIVVPPSRLYGGGLYRWGMPRVVQPFPEALLSLLTARAQALACPRFSLSSPSIYGRRAWEAIRRDPSYWLEFVLARCTIGNRHTLALFLACRLLQEAALSPAEAAGWMHAYAARVPQGSDPHTRYPEQDALACLAWAQTHVL